MNVMMTMTQEPGVGDVYRKAKHSNPGRFNICNARWIEESLTRFNANSQRDDR